MAGWMEVLRDAGAFGLLPRITPGTQSIRKEGVGRKINVGTTAADRLETGRGLDAGWRQPTDADHMNRLSRGRRYFAYARVEPLSKATAFGNRILFSR